MSQLSPAEVYDQRFVPALFAPWAARIAAHADVGPGQAVLDVACGTGALTRAAAACVGTEGEVIGLDANPEMLEVARRRSPELSWRDGVAEALPFEDARFDRAISQFGYMFFEDRVRALTELRRVLRPNGRLVVAVCDAVDHSPGYAVLTELLHRLFGPEVAQAFRAPFLAGDRDKLRADAAAAGLDGAEVTRLDGDVVFDSIDALIATERACAWTLGGLLDDEQFAALTAAAQESLAPFAEQDGAVRFGMPALVLRWEG